MRDRPLKLPTAAILTAVVLMALAIGVSAAEEARNPQQRLLDPLGIGLLMAGSLPVAVARRWPVAAYLVALIAIGGYQALGYTINSPYFLGVLVTAYTAAAPGHRQRSGLLALVAFPVYAIGAIVRDRPDLAYGVPTLTAAAFVVGQVASELRAASARSEAQ